MITKQIEEHAIKYRTVYIAADGTEFDDETTCHTYEKSLACALKTNLKEMSIRDTSTEEDLFYTGSCETEVFVVVPKTKEDILHIKQLAFGFGASEDQVSNWISEEDIDSVLLVTIGYNNEWAYVSRLNNIIKNIVGEKYKLVPTIS